MKFIRNERDRILSPNCERRLNDCDGSIYRWVCDRINLRNGMAVDKVQVMTVTAKGGRVSKFKGSYPPSWTKKFRDRFRAERGNKCERCGQEHNPADGYALTIHHLDNNKSNCEPWNLAALCQRCHLVIQGRVNMDQGWLFEHSAWMQPHVEGMNLFRKNAELRNEAE